MRSFFDASRTTWSTTEGWRFIFAFGFVSVCLALFLTIVVGRAKKCLDFAFTVYLVHFVNCCFVTGVPRGAAWWVVTGLGVSIAAIGSEYLCVTREMRDIPIGGTRV